LIVVTLLAILCGYVGYQLRTIAHRKILIEKIVHAGGTCWPDEMIDGGSGATVPLVRRWLGDEPLFWIAYPATISRPALVEIADYFPEAIISFEPPLMEQVSD
jgi:hypothetical protein